jgi:hypothetical protein
LKIQIKNHVRKERNSFLSKFVPLEKRGKKEVREDHNLVANGRFQDWWPLECSMFGGPWGNVFVWSLMEGSKLGGPWNVIFVVVIGRKRRSIFFTSFHLSPNKTLLKPFFP